RQPCLNAESHPSSEKRPGQAMHVGWHGADRSQERASAKTLPSARLVLAAQIRGNSQAPLYPPPALRLGKHCSAELRENRKPADQALCSYAPIFLKLPVTYLC